MKTSSTLLSIFGFLLTSITLSSQVYFHDFGTTSISCPFTDAPGTFDSNLSNSSWSATPNCQSFTGSSGQAISTNGGNGSFTLTFDVNSGCTLDITSFSMWTRRSGTGPTNWSLAINSTTVGSGVTSSSSSGVASGTINVSTPVTGLTGTVTVVITTSNASGSGTYRVDDFTLNGSTSCSGLPNVGFVATTSSVDEGNVGTTIH